MRAARIQQPVGAAISVGSYPLSETKTDNDSQGFVHWIRAHVYGECPACGSTHSKQLQGWNKAQCESCGKTWNY